MNKQPEFNPPRPEITGAVLYEAALSFVLKHPDIQPASAERLAGDIARECDTSGNDGYELARNLERQGWDPSAETVELLDAFDSYLHKNQRLAELAWAEENNIRPPFAVGTTVMFLSGEVKTGVIAGIYEHEAASYLIQTPNHTDMQRAIVKFEDCWLPEAEDEKS